MDQVACHGTTIKISHTNNEIMIILINQYQKAIVFLPLIKLPAILVIPIIDRNIMFAAKFSCRIIFIQRFLKQKQSKVVIQ